MITKTPITKKRADKNGSSPRNNGINGYRSAENWPFDIEEAYRRIPGPYTLANALTLIDEEPLELYNGWLVWQEMTEPEERRIAGTIQTILDLTARACGFGQAYPDQVECKMVNEDVYKPDVCVISNKRFESRVEPAIEGNEHTVLRGSPELVVEIRSPSNRRTKERRKRKFYFESEALVIWDVDYKKHKIWVYEAADPEKGQEYNAEDMIGCEQLLPGWRRKVADLFNLNLSAEEVVGELAQQWRAESKEQGELEALRKVLLRQASRRYGEANLPDDLETRLKRYKADQLIDLADEIAISLNLDDWLAGFPD